MIVDNSGICSGCSKGDSEAADALLMPFQGIENKEVQFTTQACNVNCCFLVIENCHCLKLNILFQNSMDLSIDNSLLNESGSTDFDPAFNSTFISDCRVSIAAQYYFVTLLV